MMMTDMDAGCMYVLQCFHLDEGSETTTAFDFPLLCVVFFIFFFWVEITFPALKMCHRVTIFTTNPDFN